MPDLITFNEDVRPDWRTAFSGPHSPSQGSPSSFYVPERSIPVAVRVSLNPEGQELWLTFAYPTELDPPAAAGEVRKLHTTVGKSLVEVALDGRRDRVMWLLIRPFELAPESVRSFCKQIPAAGAIYRRQHPEVNAYHHIAIQATLDYVVKELLPRIADALRQRMPPPTGPAPGQATG